MYQNHTGQSVQSQPDPVQDQGSKSSLGTTYELTQPPKGLKTDLSNRFDRYSLQSVAAEVLHDQRVAWCCRRVLDKREFGIQDPRVQVWKRENLEEVSCYYKNLIKCGSVWTCPVCSNKISEHRRRELVQGVETHLAAGGSVSMLTLTIRHTRQDRLLDLLNAFSLARRLYRNRKTWKRYAPAVGLQGSVMALEVTYGKNGWHVHSHEVLFTEGPVRASDQRMLSIAWRKAVVDAGLPAPTLERGLVLDDREAYAAAYAAKWGIEEEITKSQFKSGGKGGLSPWQMLREIFEHGQDKRLDLVRAFREYGRHFKGKSQLRWSKGLRSLLGLDLEVQDQDLVDQDPEDYVLTFLGYLSSEQWKVILRHDVRGQVLKIAEKDGWPGVIAYVQGLRGLFVC